MDDRLANASANETRWREAKTEEIAERVWHDKYQLRKQQCEPVEGTHHETFERRFDGRRDV